MNYFSDNPSDVGITVVGGVTGLGKTTQLELEQKIGVIKESLRVKNVEKPLVMDEFWNAEKSDLISELRNKHPSFKVGDDN